MRQKESTIEQFYGTRRAAKLSGLTEYMVNYLARTEVLLPSQPRTRTRGLRRRYSFGDVVMLRVLASLLEAGISVARIKNSLTNLREHHPEITPSSLPSKYLVTDGSEVFFLNDDDTLEALNSEGQLAFMFLIEMEQARTAVHEAEVA